MPQTLEIINKNRGAILDFFKKTRIFLQLVEITHEKRTTVLNNLLN